HDPGRPQQDRDEHRQDQPEPGPPAQNNLVIELAVDAVQAEEQPRARARDRQDRADADDGADGDRVVESAAVIEQALPGRWGHGLPFCKAAAMRSSRGPAVTSPSTMMRARPAAISPRPCSSAGCQPAGVNPQYTATTVTINMRCCLAIGPQKSLGAP